MIYTGLHRLCSLRLCTSENTITPRARGPCACVYLVSTMNIIARKLKWNSCWLVYYNSSWVHQHREHLCYATSSGLAKHGHKWTKEYRQRTTNNYDISIEYWTIHSSMIRSGWCLHGSVHCLMTMHLRHKLNLSWTWSTNSLQTCTNWSYIIKRLLTYCSHKLSKHTNNTHNLESTVCTYTLHSSCAITFPGIGKLRVCDRHYCRQSSWASVLFVKLQPPR